MNDNTKRAIWEELIASAPKPPPPVDREAGEMTAQDLADRLNLSVRQAARWADHRVAEGKLIKAKRTQGHFRVNAWRPVT